MHIEPKLSRRSVLLGGIGLLVAACGVGGATNTNISLAFWKPPGLPTAQENKFYGDLIARYQKENPTIHLTHLDIPWASASEKYTAAFASNNPPDVSYQIVNWLSNFSSQNTLMAIEDIDASGNLFKGVFQAYANGSIGPDGKHYGVPYYGSQWVLTVNQANWIRAGKPAFPKTYDEMVPFAQALTFDKNGKRADQAGFDKNNIDAYGYLQASDTPTLVNYIWNYLWAYGVDYVSKDGKDIGFDNPQGRAALTVMKKMVDSGAATPLNLYPDSQSAVDAFLSGKIGMSWFQTFDPTSIQTYKNTRLLVLPVPSGPAGQFLVGGAGYLTISKKSGHAPEGLKFIQFLTQEANVRSYLRATRLSPVKPMGDTLYKGIGPDEAFMNASVQQGKYVRLTRVGLPYDPQEVIVGEIINYLGGRKSMDTVLKDLHHSVQIMARNAGM